VPPVDIPFEPDAVARASGPLVQVELDSAGHPVMARAAVLVDTSPSRVWDAVSDVRSYAGRVPMIDGARVEGDRVTMNLRFRVSLLSVGFSFQAKREREEGRWIEIAHLSGEPRDLRIRFDLHPREDATLLVSSVGFDITSLGWLVKFFLKHHPEIRYGVFPGCALALLDAMKRTAEGTA
jgi:ribosome-associated toxin RatA of RatAB toxin-antitoxin module